ncbi:MAG TPA: zinc-ribbon domain-containing protein [Rhodopila sp.]|nr:zinc-ribbon domain-containing protein [Rhodopila sp.]
MRIICPNCAAQYEVPTQRLPRDRKVRCARCNALWRVSTEPTPVAAASVAAASIAPMPAAPDLRWPEPRPAPAADTAQVTAATPPPPNWGPKLGWAVSIMVLVILCAAVFHWRAEVIRLWPPSGRILALANTGANTGHMYRIRNYIAPEVVLNVADCT